jgi:hypothetical protein
MLRRVCGPVCLPLALLWAYCEFVSRWPLPEGWAPILTVTAGGGAIVGVCALAMELLQRLARETAVPTERIPVEASA